MFSYVARDRFDPPDYRCRVDVDQSVAVREIRRFVLFSQSKGVGKTDSPGFSRRHKSEASHEEHLAPIDPLIADSCDLEAKRIGYRVPEPLGEDESANRGAVEEPDSRGVSRIELAMPLGLNNRVDERKLRPGFVYSLLLQSGDHIGCSLVRRGKALLRQLPEDRGLARPRRTGEYVSIDAHGRLWTQFPLSGWWSESINSPAG